jgi:hypothetical protein
MKCLMNKLARAQRVHVLTLLCEGMSMRARDHASAMVIYDRAVVGPGIGNVVRLGKRRFGNISLEISK